MKGIIFTELLAFMDDVHGEAFTEAVIARAALPDEAAFTSVGNYPHERALALIAAAAALSGAEGAALCERFGRWLYDRFHLLFPALMARYATAEALLMHVGTHIHEEVSVLYPEARPPEVECRNDDGRLTLSYRSHRPMAHLARGLVGRCLERAGDTRTLSFAIAPDGREALFVIAPPSPTGTG